MVRNRHSSLPLQLKLILVNVGLLAVLLVGLELTGQVAHRLLHFRWPLEGPPPLLHRSVFRQHPFLVGQGPRITLTHVLRMGNALPERS